VNKSKKRIEDFLKGRRSSKVKNISGSRGRGENKGSNRQGDQ
jgi:hypothetical protein